MEGSFIHRLQITDLDLTILQGSDDDLVPLRQATKLCEQLGNNVAIPTDLTGLPSLIETQCSQKVSLNIIQGAQHMLDFGLCLGDVCPAGPEGSESRESSEKSLSDGFLWLGEANNNSAPNNTAIVAATDEGGSGSIGAMSIAAMVLFLLYFYFVNFNMLNFRGKA